MASVQISINQLINIIDTLIKEPLFCETYFPNTPMEKIGPLICDFFIGLTPYILNQNDVSNIFTPEFISKHSDFFENKSIETNSIEHIKEKSVYIYNKINKMILDMNSIHLYTNVFQNIINDKELLSEPIYYYPQSDKIAVIMDPRYDSLMEAVIVNFMHFMNPLGWNLLIISHSRYANDIKTRFPNCILYLIDETLINYDNNNIPNIFICTYNNIFLSKSFWESIPGSTIAIFQKDCIMYKMFDETFLQYAYSGANFYGQDTHYHYGGINGGFSIRNKAAMIECITKINWDIINDYNSMMHNFVNKINGNSVERPLGPCRNEDVFFTAACEILNLLVPDQYYRNKLAIETKHYPDTCVYHGWNKNYHNIDFAINMLKKSPLFTKYI